MSTKPQSQVTNQALVDAAKAPIISYNEKNWDAVRDAVSTGYRYDEIATRRNLQGIEEVLAAWRGWAAAFPDSRAEIHDTHVSGNTVVIELTWRGTHNGPLQTPRGDIPPTKRRIDVRACQITEVENGKAVSTRHYFDMSTLLNQIGVAP